MRERDEPFFTQTNQLLIKPGATKSAWRENNLKQLISSSVRKRLSVVAVASALVLTGCEAPLVLDGVEQEKSKPVRRSDNFQSIAVNDSAILVVGDAGTTLVSNDDGKTWVRNRLPGSPFLMAAATCPDQRFLAIDYQHNLWMANADGTGWQAKPVDTQETPQTLTCDNQGRIWIVGGFSSIVRSDDMGESWNESSLDQDLHFTTVQFVDADNGFLTGEFGVVANTQDGGETWEMLEPIPDEFYPQDAWFESVEKGWVVGLNGTIFMTEDGANSWQHQETGTDEPIHGISANGDSLYAVGGNGLLLICEGCRNASAEEAVWRRVQHKLPVRFYLRGVAEKAGQLWVAGGAGAMHGLALADVKNKKTGHAE